jgi:succinate-semialdehyde dehydrogenase/glutarate-semialdehyde dehydrogenase
MRLQDFKVLAFDVVGTPIDFECSMPGDRPSVAPAAAVTDDAFLAVYRRTRKSSDVLAYPDGLERVWHAIAPALAAGCTVVCKPAEDTPRTSPALVKLAEEAGVPAGALNIVTALRVQAAEVVDVWLDDPQVRRITFTGSSPVGKHLACRAAETLKRLSLELGGNAPFIVFNDADLEVVVDGLMAAKFRNGGRTCVGPNRVFAQFAAHDHFVEKLSARIALLEVGPASDLASQIGPMINAPAIEKIERRIGDALERGERIVTGGRRLAALGPNDCAPTLLTGANGRKACSSGQALGPEVPVTRFGTEAEMIAAANDTRWGLAAYFYSTDVHRIWRVAEAAPIGGVKDSGYGRKGSVHRLDDCMQLKYLCPAAVLSRQGRATIPARRDQMTIEEQ